MISALLILIAATLACIALGFSPRLARYARLAAVLGVGIALAVALWQEGLQGGVAGSAITWPQAPAWLGEPAYRSDSLSAGLGAWCLLLGGLCLLKMGDSGNASAPWQLGMVAILYSLVHTTDLLWMASHVLFLTLLAWLFRAFSEEAEGQALDAGLVGMGFGAVALLAMGLLVGRTTGGSYSLADLSLSALTVWPLPLLAAFAMLWLGLLPFTGWSAIGHGPVGATQALVQSLAVGVPVLTVVLRLQALVTAQGPAGSAPEEWSASMTALAWLGGLTALVAGAGMVVWAGATRWTALLTAHAMGLMLWGLALDTPTGRLAALAVFVAYGAGRVTLELASTGAARFSRTIAAASLAAAPLTAGFVAVWLLGVALSEAGRPSLIVALAGAVILAACSIVLHLGVPISEARRAELPYLRWVGLTGAAALLAGGIMPYLWLPLVAGMSSVAGGSPQVVLPWTGLSVAAGQELPVLLLGLGALLLAGILWLVAAWAKSSVSAAGVLLPTALDRLAKQQALASRPSAALEIRSNPPAALWWLSLVWLESGVAGTGALFSRLGRRTGAALAHLEGRFYLPLALLLTLLTLLMTTR